MEKRLMEFKIPDSCGNSPRMAIVAEIISHWAKAESAELAKWLADDVTWTYIGVEPHVGPEAAADVVPVRAERGGLLSVVNHGKFAACDGYLEEGGKRIDFAHMIEFTGAAKTAKVAAVRTFLVGATPPWER